MVMTPRKRNPRPQDPADPSPIKKRKLRSSGRKPRAQSAGCRRSGRTSRRGPSDSEVVSSSEDVPEYEKVRQQRMRENREKMEKLGIFTLSQSLNAKKTVRRAPAKKVVSSEEEEDEDGAEEDVPEYEKVRQQRIRENKERMEKLGIFTLSQSFNAKKTVRRAPAKKKPSIARSFVATHERARRSARIKERGPHLKGEGTLESMGISVPKAWAPEVYTEEHEKLLGKCEEPWTLYVDGYGEDGERLYDLVHGKMCHQCRQKTVGHVSLCRKCKSAQGQICGDCLYMRYGENVLEANENVNWSCPSCRGICNCSRCRRAKGWAPTVCLYPKVIELGYKSVAHYLIQTRNAKSKPNYKTVAGAKANPKMSPQSAPQIVVDLDTSDGDYSAVNADASDLDASQEAYESRRREPCIDAATNGRNETPEPALKVVADSWNEEGGGSNDI